jgi:MFS family permease
MPVDPPASGTAPPTEPPAASAVPELAASPASAYALFLGGMASWFTAWGVQNVMLQWLVVQELGVSATRVGTAQMALLLPSLLFLLLGGAVADRVNRRRALIVLHALAALSCTALGVLVGAHALSYGAVVSYALAVGTLQAFVLPARDALFSSVIGARMGRAVAGLTIVQQGGQALGAAAAGLASPLGGPAVLGLQALLLLGGAAFIKRLPRDLQPPPGRRPPLHLRELRPGVLEVARSPILRPLVLLNVSVGLVFLSTYVVLLPLLVRELYGGGAGRLAGLAAAVPIGTVASTLVIGARGGLVRPGRALLLGQGIAGLCVGALALGLPYWGAVLAVTGWGVSGAFSINSSRTLFQQHASEENRGRVLSVYSFAVLGAGPLGALGTGLLAQALGAATTLAMLGAGMTLAILAAQTFTRIHHFR